MTTCIHTIRKNCTFAANFFHEYEHFLALCLVGCAKKQPEKLPMKELHSEADLTGLRVGVRTGGTYDLHLSSRKDITEMGYNSISDALLALTQGKLDVFVEDESSIPRDEQKRLGITIAFYGDEAIPCAFPMHKGDDGLRDSLSHFIDSLNATGEMQEIHDRWFLSDNPSQMRIPDLGPEPTGKPILVGSAIEMPPVAFHVSSVWQGFEPEVLQRFSRYVGRPLKFDYYPLPSAISALQSNKIHVIVGGIFITEERQKTMDFSSSHFSVRAAYYVKDENAQTASFGDKLKNMVYNQPCGGEPLEIHHRRSVGDSQDFSVLPPVGHPVRRRNLRPADEPQQRAFPHRQNLH